MSVLVSIDPGLSTGVAVFEDGRLDYSYTSQPPHDRLRRTLSLANEIVCERGPTNHRRQAEACEPVEAIVTEHNPGFVFWLRPTAWKGHPQAKDQPGDDPLTKHERDAIRMGRVWLARRGDLDDAPGT